MTPQARASRALEERLRTTNQCDECIFDKPNFDEANFERAKIRRAALSGSWKNANMRGADLTGSSLSGDFEGADLRDAVLTGAHLYGRFAKTRFDGVDLHRTLSLTGGDWREVNLEGANLEGVRFAGLSGTLHCTPGSNYLSAPSCGTTLAGANLSHANLRSVSLGQCDLRGADLRGADLEGASLPTDPADLEGTDFSGAMGPWGLRCAESSVGRCIPMGSPKELREMRKRQKRSCIDGWPCEYR